MIDPAHQRHGIGGKLLSAVLQKATDEKLATFLMSSAESFGLYTRLGFGDLGRWVVDNGYWMREVAAREEEMTILGGSGFGRRDVYEGVWEVENVMVKRP
jgi:GNAT superfamily N-acetyltransferase